MTQLWKYSFTLFALVRNHLDCCKSECIMKCLYYSRVYIADVRLQKKHIIMIKLSRFNKILKLKLLNITSKCCTKSYKQVEKKNSKIRISLERFTHNDFTLKSTIFFQFLDIFLSLAYLFFVKEFLYVKEKCIHMETFLQNTSFSRRAPESQHVYLTVSQMLSRFL